LEWPKIVDLLADEAVVLSTVFQLRWHRQTIGCLRRHIAPLMVPSWESQFFHQEEEEEKGIHNLCNSFLVHNLCTSFLELVPQDGEWEEWKNEASHLDEGIGDWDWHLPGPPHPSDAVFQAAMPTMRLCHHHHHHNRNLEMKGSIFIRPVYLDAKCQPPPPPMGIIVPLMFIICCC
jgi:hypothetical protein